MSIEGNNNNFTIKDTSSEFAKLLPNKWIEPLIIIAKIRGYNRIDDYILELIKSRLQMFLDTSDTIEFDEFQEYIHNTIVGKDVPNEWVRRSKQQQEEEEEEEEDKKKEEESRSNSSNNDGYRKFVKDVNKPIIAFPSKKEVENRWGKISDEEENDKENLK